MEYYITEKINIDLTNLKLKIIGDEFKHLSKVLRKKTGDEITVTDGLYNIYKCKITGISDSEIICDIIKIDSNLFEPEIKIKLFISRLKNSDRFEFAIEKCTELGVFDITPVITKYTELKDKLNETKLKRFSKIIRSAVSQSQRCYLPILNNSLTFKELLKVTENFSKKIVMYEFSDTDSRIEGDFKNDYICLLIGPEGGFSTEEIDELKKNNWSVKSLGERKLRAETASVVSVFQILNNLKLKN
ncbi:MAG TPA: 16S rRNA (uracil(1498)-N(3))-methyltransferase [Ignavibacteria bacterium]|nr:16S rRNA (uracil(1498)-N(3))-methyltransferase [Ignavibacteria bacterium]